MKPKTRIKKLAAEMRNAEKAWNKLRDSEKKFRAAWDESTQEERIAAFKEIGVDAMESICRGHSHDAFTGFGC